MGILDAPAERLANKSTDGTFAANSDTKYPSQKAAKTYVDTALAAGIPAVSIAVLAEVVLVAQAATIDFTGISAAYRHLEIIFSGAGTNGGSSVEPVKTTFNGDSSAIYDQQIHISGGTTTAGQALAAQTWIEAIHMSRGGLSKVGSGRILIPDYAGTTRHKSLVATSGMIPTESSASTWITRTVFGVYRSTTAISRVTLAPSVSTNFAAGTIATLIGVGGPGQTVSGPAVLDGGTP